MLIKLIQKLNLQNLLLLAIPRGGIQVAEPIAHKLKIPIYPFIVKKLPIPDSPETAFGAIAPDGTMVLDEKTIRYLGLTENIINATAERVKGEITHRIKIYGGFNVEEIRGKDVIVVDDGVATGYSLIAALKSIKKMLPKSLTVCVPVSSYNAFQKIIPLVDNIVCPIVDEYSFFAVGYYYEEFNDLPEDEIKAILGKYR